MAAGTGGDTNAFAALDAALGIALPPALLTQALTHRSYAYENGGLPTNERLEFLGDALLGLVIAESLYRAYPGLPEGQLAKLRSGVVNRRALAEVARALGLGQWVRLGRGEETTGGRDKSSIVGNTVEALLGAVYLECGMDAAAAVVHRLFDPVITRSALLGAGLDWKTSLQELTAARSLGVPDYLVHETGPDHAKRFTAQAVVAGQVLGAGPGRTKKEAEQRAARLAWEALREEAESKAADEPDGGQVADPGPLAADNDFPPLVER